MIEHSSLIPRHSSLSLLLLFVDVDVFSVDHIAIISRIVSRGPDYVECWVSESRGESHGGVQNNKWRFTKSGSGFDTKNLSAGGNRFIDEIWRFPAVGV